MALPKKKRSRDGDVDLKSPDEFITFTSTAMKWASANRKPLIIGGAAFVVVVAVVTGLRTHARNTAEERSTRLAAAVEILNAPVESPEAAAEDPEGTPAASEDGPTFPDAASRAQDVLTQLEGVSGGSGAAALSDLARAAAHLDLGEADKAVKAYQDFLDSGVSEELRFFGLSGMITALRNKGDLAGALERAKALGALGDGVYADHAAWLTARILESKGDSEAARAEYKRLVDTWPDSLLKGDAQKRLDLLGG